MKGQTVDRLALHQKLYERADRFGKIEIYQIGLAEELHVTKATMSLVIKELVEDGRIRKVASRKRNIGVYSVKDPGLFEHPFIPTRVPGIGIERCKTCGELEQIGKHAMAIK